jgi:hypothetical protein
MVQQLHNAHKVTVYVAFVSIFSSSAYLVTQIWKTWWKKSRAYDFVRLTFLFLVELDCGGKISENITHFTKSISEGSSLTGKCEAKVCRLSNNICQLRLDFSTFILAGPSTDTRTTHYTSFGSVVGHSAPSRIAQTSIGEEEFSLSQY